ncbi:glycosyl hydrolases family 28-domain-containing protein [Aspergillus similis]
MLSSVFLLSSCLAGFVAAEWLPGYPVWDNHFKIPCSGSKARTSPSSGAIVVDQSEPGHPGSYKTVQEGVDALNATTNAPQELFIFPGTYEEQVYIPPLESNLTVQGYTCNSASYEGNAATITYNLALINTTNDDHTATLRQWNTNTKIYNLNILNTFGHIPKNGQNLALSAYNTNQGYYGCQFIGYQDTVLAETGYQLYAKSLIVGAVDFIFGQTALAWFENVDIRTIAAGCVTASGRSSDGNPSWYVISRSNVSGINDTIPAADNYLGRPWESFARVVFQQTYLGKVIAPAGWEQWSTSSPNTENVTFAEYANYGPGSDLEEGPRASFSEQLDAPIEIQSILGRNFEHEWWVDTDYLDKNELVSSCSVARGGKGSQKAEQKCTTTVKTSATSTTIAATSTTVSSTSTLTSTTTSTGAPCTCTEYSQISSAVASCTSIVLSNIAAPNGSAIDLSNLQTGTTVTFDGLTTFGFTNSSSFNPVTIGGKDITITATEGAVIDGNGQAYWDGLGSNGGVPKPDHFIVVNKVTGNSVIEKLYIQNWPVHLFSISSCSNLIFQDMILNNTAGNEPNSRSSGLAAAHNSDGFDVSSSYNITIQRNSVYNQDDCVAITSGNNMTVSEMLCSGGHGLSIGSVGGKSNNNVTNILFTNSVVLDSQNGARIKTNYNTTGFISNVTYSNIAVNNISIYGIDLQQDYLNGGPTGIPSSGVVVENILWQNVTGSMALSGQDYYILCGKDSCSNLAFEDVSITGGGVSSSCNYNVTGCS